MRERLIYTFENIFSLGTKGFPEMVIAWAHVSSFMSGLQQLFGISYFLMTVVGENFKPSPFEEGSQSAGLSAPQHCN